MIWLMITGCVAELADTATEAIVFTDNRVLELEPGSETRWLIEVGATEAATDWRLNVESALNPLGDPVTVDWTVFAGAPLSNEGEIIEEGAVDQETLSRTFGITLQDCVSPPCGASIIIKWIAREDGDSSTIRFEVATESVEQVGLSLGLTQLL